MEGIEILVVDNQSGDENISPFQAQHPAVRFIENSGNWGFANACNVGATATAADQLLFLNPDTLAYPKDIFNLLEIKKAHQINLLTCRQIDATGKNQKAFGNLETFWTSFSPIRRILQKTNPQLYPSPRVDHKERVFCECISGSMVMISREDYDKLGGWDDRFWMYAEDADLCKRALAAGMTIAYEPSVTITHFHGGASRANPETKALTKSEVTISRHVFNDKHQPNWLYRWAAHGNTFLRRSLPVFLFALLSSPLLITSKRNGALRKAKHLSTYYYNWLRSGDCRSIRAIRKQVN